MFYHLYYSCFCLSSVPLLVYFVYLILFGVVLITRLLIKLSYNLFLLIYVDTFFSLRFFCEPLTLWYLLFFSGFAANGYKFCTFEASKSISLCVHQPVSLIQSCFMCLVFLGQLLNHSFSSIISIMIFYVSG